MNQPQGYLKRLLKLPQSGLHRTTRYGTSAVASTAVKSVLLSMPKATMNSSVAAVVVVTLAQLAVGAVGGHCLCALRGLAVPPLWREPLGTWVGAIAVRPPLYMKEMGVSKLRFLMTI